MDILYRLYEGGGIITIFIVLSGVITLYLVLERLYHFQRARIDVDEFISGVSNNLRHDNIIEAIKICDETPGPIPHIIRTAILRADRQEHELREAVYDVSLAEVPRLEKNLTLLATLAHLTPLLGLLGTVVGMIGAFSTLKTVGVNASAADLAESIELALYTTAAGLSVAIPAHGFYNVLLRRVQDITLDMEKACTDIVYFLTHHKINVASLRANTAGRDA